MINHLVSLQKTAPIAIVNSQRILQYLEGFPVKTENMKESYI